MNAIQYNNLASEVSMLKDILGHLPEGNIIDRISLEHRLKKASLALENTNPYHINKKAKLTFRGDSVIGSEAIAAGFAAKATDLFSEAIAALSASFVGALHFKGPIPNKHSNQLLITGTAIGSFGFEFELPKMDDTDLCPNPSIVEKAVDEARRLFEVAATGSDNDLSDVVDAVHPRAIKKVYDFLGFLNEHNSLCGLEFNNHFFKFLNHNQLELAALRLKDENIHEEQVSFAGLFQGVLPTSKTFEFKTIIDSDLIKGKINREILNPELINQDWLLKPVVVVFTTTRVGNSAPKYTLNSLSDIRLRSST
jgi:hypothetical protein